MPRVRARGQIEGPATRKAASGTIEQDRSRSEGVVDGPYPAALFETRIIHLGDTRLAYIG